MTLGCFGGVTLGRLLGGVTLGRLLGGVTLGRLLGGATLGRLLGGATLGGATLGGATLGRLGGATCHHHEYYGPPYDATLNGVSTLCAVVSSIWSAPHRTCDFLTWRHFLTDDAVRCELLAFTIWL